MCTHPAAVCYKHALYRPPGCAIRREFRLSVCLSVCTVHGRNLATSPTQIVASHRAGLTLMIYWAGRRG